MRYASRATGWVGSRVVAEMVKWRGSRAMRSARSTTADWGRARAGTRHSDVRSSRRVSGRIAREFVIQLIAINEPLLGRGTIGLRKFVLDETVSAAHGAGATLARDRHVSAWMTVPMPA